MFASKTHRWRNGWRNKRNSWVSAAQAQEQSKQGIRTRIRNVQIQNEQIQRQSSITGWRYVSDTLPNCVYSLQRSLLGCLRHFTMRMDSTACLLGLDSCINLWPESVTINWTYSDVNVYMKLKQGLKVFIFRAPEMIVPMKVRDNVYILLRMKIWELYCPVPVDVI